MSEKSLNKTVLPNYGKVRADEAVKISLLFDNVKDFFLGRIGISSPVFPPTPSINKSRTITGAAAGFDRDQVTLKAFAEFVERASSFLSGAFNKELIKASVKELKSQKIVFVSPFDVTFPQKDLFSETSIISWCKGIRLVTGEEFLVPALLAYSRWQPSKEKEVIFWQPDATGLAAHTIMEKAIFNGICEVLERHFCMLSWITSSLPVRELNISSISVPILDLCQTLDIKYRGYCIQVDNLPLTVIAFLYKEDGSSLTCGSACGEFGTDLINKAFNEAFMLQWTMNQQQFWLNRENLESNKSLTRVFNAFQEGKPVLNWYQNHAQRLPVNTFGQFTTLIELAESVEKIFNTHLIYVDVTDPIGKKSGWNVYKVIIPGTIKPNIFDNLSTTQYENFKAEVGSNYGFTVSSRNTPPPFG